MTTTVNVPVRPGRGAVALLGLLAATVLVALSAMTAAAHSQLLRSTPADGAVLTRQPQSVEFVFNEDINPAFAQVVVRGPGGGPVPLPDPTVSGPSVRVALPDSPLTGTVTAAYRVSSKDGHPISGQISFTIRGAGASGTLAPSGAGSGAASRPAGEPAVQTTLAAAPTSTDGDTNAAMYLLTGAGAIGLIVLGGLVLWWDRRRTPSDAG